MEKPIYKNNFFTDVKPPRELKMVGYEYEDYWYSTKEDDQYYRFRPIYEVDIPKHKRHIVKVFYKEVGINGEHGFFRETEKINRVFEFFYRNNQVKVKTKKELIDYIKEVVKGRQG